MVVEVVEKIGRKKCGRGEVRACACPSVSDADVVDEGLRERWWCGKVTNGVQRILPGDLSRSAHASSAGSFLSDCWRNARGFKLRSDLNEWPRGLVWSDLFILDLCSMKQTMKLNEGNKLWPILVTVEKGKCLMVVGFFSYASCTAATQSRVRHAWWRYYAWKISSSLVWMEIKFISVSLPRYNQSSLVEHTSSHFSLCSYQLGGLEP